MPARDQPAVMAMVGMGANLDDPLQQIARAFDELAQLPDSRLTQRSSLYRSAPVGKTDQPAFINAIAVIETRLGARQLLDALLQIEQQHGRRRTEPNGPRTLDLDLLLYGSQTISESGLEVPHPRMHARRFVLDPLVEVAPDCDIPGKGPVRNALAQVLDQGVERITGGMP